MIFTARTPGWELLNLREDKHKPADIRLCGNWIRLGFVFVLYLSANVESLDQLLFSYGPGNFSGKFLPSSIGVEFI